MCVYERLRERVRVCGSAHTRHCPLLHPHTTSFHCPRCPWMSSKPTEMQDERLRWRPEMKEDQTRCESNPSEGEGKKKRESACVCVRERERVSYRLPSGGVSHGVPHAWCHMRCMPGTGTGVLRHAGGWMAVWSPARGALR